MSNIHHDPEHLGVDDEWNVGDPVPQGVPHWLTNMLAEDVLSVTAKRWLPGDD